MGITETGSKYQVKNVIKQDKTKNHLQNEL